LRPTDLPPAKWLFIGRFHDAGILLRDHTKAILCQQVGNLLGKPVIPVVLFYSGRSNIEPGSDLASLSNPSTISTHLEISQVSTEIVSLQLFG